jgi:O-antigen/teichoic acid export membrane protein
MIDCWAARCALANPFQNILRLSVGDFLAKTLNFLAFVYLARRLGVEIFGVLEFANGLLTYFLLLADAGVEIWATREASRAVDLRGLAGRVLPLRFSIAALAFGALLAILAWLPDYVGLKPLLVLFGLTLFAQAVSLKWLFMGQQKMTRVAAGLVVSQMVFAATVFGFVRDAGQLLRVGVFKLAADAALALFFALRFAREHGGLRLPLTLRGARAMLRPALTIGAANAMGLLNFNFDSILLGFLKGPVLVGLYTAAYRPVTIALALPVTYFQGLFPALSQLFAEDREAFLHLARRSLRLCAIFAVPVGVGGVMLAEPVILFIFGSNYADSAVPLRILVWSAVFVVIRGSYRHALNAAGLQNLDLRAAVSSSVVNVGLNIALIPKFGMVGAACATVLGDFVWFAMAGWYFTRRVRSLHLFSLLGRPVLAAALMGALLGLTPGIPWILRAILSGVFYFAVLLALGEPEVRARFARHFGRRD